jgi:hypothetical protein
LNSILKNLTLFFENVEIQLSENVLFLPEYKAPFYRLVSDPVSDSNPDLNLDSKCLFRIQIGSGQKLQILTDQDQDPDQDPNPQH